MEKDDELAGEGNSYTTHFRQYDSRIGRWLSLDPKAGKYASISPYASFLNNPIYFTDPYGDDPPETVGGLLDYLGNYEGNGLSRASNTGELYSWFDGTAEVNGFSCIQSCLNFYGISNDVFPKFVQTGRSGSSVTTQHEYVKRAEAGKAVWEGSGADALYTVVTGKDVDTDEETSRTGAVIELGLTLIPGEFGPLENKAGRFVGKYVDDLTGYAYGLKRTVLRGKDGKLAKHAKDLGFPYSPQLAQSHTDEIFSKVNDLVSIADLSRIKVGRYHGFNNAIFYISEGKMIITQSDGTFVSAIGKTSSDWYQKAKYLNPIE